MAYLCTATKSRLCKPKVSDHVHVLATRITHCMLDCMHRKARVKREALIFCTE